MAEQQPQPYCIVPASLPPIVVPTSVPSPTSYIYTLPTIRSFNHIVVFLLPGITLPPNTAAAVYMSSSGGVQAQGDFKFLGGIGEGKESAIYKVSGLVGNVQGGSTPEITIGISLEPADEVATKIAALHPTNTSNNDSQALVPASKSPSGPANPDQTVRLAQKIIKNAFNFLASFSGNLANGVEVVPLKAFEEWWKKFEGKVVRDPGFLERGDNG